MRALGISASCRYCRLGQYGVRKLWHQKARLWHHLAVAAQTADPAYAGLVRSAAARWREDHVLGSQCFPTPYGILEHTLVFSPERLLSCGPFTRMPKE